MVAVSGLSFDGCFEKAIYFEEDGIQIRTIHIDNLIIAKKSSGRPKDLDDLENLIIRATDLYQKYSLP
jgi:predicted nucleotidyltransferase